ncbi:MAG: isoprenylcysteine carboxylmethyltransferase family protein [Gemmatimonadota bacterium]|nr:MAG: isoprenylcysteine carboxylmethyltransferase family protein [Gemmatimonadota bacterium]
MNTARYVVAIVMLVGVSYAVPYWLIIHPFVDFWRRLGLKLAYSLLTLISILLGVGAYLLKDRILVTEFGTSMPLIVLAGVLYAVAIVIQLQCRKHLKFRILAGVPELQPSSAGGRLLHQGIYARIRHPRYVSFMFGVSAVALFTNYLAMYLLVVISAAALYLVVLLEEKELRNRFGDEYVQYCERVPRFFPHVSSR